MIRNFTPHPVTIVLSEPEPVGHSLFFPSEGNARCAARSTPVEHAVNAKGVSVVRTAFGEVTGLPDAVDGVTLIVSGLVLDHPSTVHRTDLAAPGAPVRDPSGAVIACAGLRVR